MEQFILHLLRRAIQRAERQFSDQARESDVTPRQFAVLDALSRQESVSQTDLCSATGIDRSTLADIVKRLLKKGLIQRARRKDDARAYAVKLSAEGKRRLKSLTVDRVHASVLQSLPETRRRQFLKDLKTIAGENGAGATQDN
jgi:MarR family transcriptional regulator, temperature-dependent positive regulator of motility